MPRISRAFIKTGLLFFLLALLFGVALEIEAFANYSLVPLFWHLLMVGWITQIIFGVSLWMFPGRTREEGFVAQVWGWLSYSFLNAGLLLRLITEPWINISEVLIWNILIIFSAVMQLLVAITYTIEM